MYMFIAKNDKQLGLCLKLLYSEHIDYSVDLELTKKDRVIYKIWVDISSDAYSELESKYRILIG